MEERCSFCSASLPFESPENAVEALANAISKHVVQFLCVFALLLHCGFAYAAGGGLLD
ncbi:hypothetical protein ACLOJK_004702 [Asimina triloba]